MRLDSTLEQALALRPRARSAGTWHRPRAPRGRRELNTTPRDFNRAREVYAEATAVYEAAGSQGDVYVANVGACGVRIASRPARGRRSDCFARLLLALESLLTRRSRSRPCAVAGMLAAGKVRRGARRISAGRGSAASCQESGLTLFSALEEEVERSYVDRARGDLGDSPLTRRRPYERGSGGLGKVLGAAACPSHP